MVSPRRYKCLQAVTRTAIGLVDAGGCSLFPENAHNIEMKGIQGPTIALLSMGSGGVHVTVP